jgi:hypothetical protein
MLWAVDVSAMQDIRDGWGQFLNRKQGMVSVCPIGQLRPLRDTNAGAAGQLGEWADRQLSRLDNGHIHWLALDLPKVIDLGRPPRSTSPGM